MARQGGPRSIHARRPVLSLLPYAGRPIRRAGWRRPHARPAAQPTDSLAGPADNPPPDHWTDRVPATRFAPSSHVSPSTKVSGAGPLSEAPAPPNGDKQPHRAVAESLKYISASGLTRRSGLSLAGPHSVLIYRRIDRPRKAGLSLVIHTFHQAWRAEPFQPTLFTTTISLSRLARGHYYHPVRLAAGRSACWDRARLGLISIPPR